MLVFVALVGVDVDAVVGMCAGVAVVVGVVVVDGWMIEVRVDVLSVLRICERRQVGS